MSWPTDLFWGYLKQSTLKARFCIAMQNSDNSTSCPFQQAPVVGCSMNCNFIAVFWSPIQLWIRACFQELRPMEIWEGADGSKGANTPVSRGSWGRLQRKGNVEKRQTAQCLELPMGRFSVEDCSEASCDDVRRFHPSALFFTFHSLNPFTSYKLRVKATNDIGDSDFSTETEAVTTLQDGKRGGKARWGHCRGMDAPQCS